MKRSWIGFVLLVLLLATALLSAAAMIRLCEEDVSRLTAASGEALKGNWEAAACLIAQAHHSWDSWEFFRCAMADHTPAEEIEALFSRLEVYSSARERITFAAVCREAAQKLEALGDAHRLNLHNLL